MITGINAFPALRMFFFLESATAALGGCDAGTPRHVLPDDPSRLNGEQLKFLYLLTAPDLFVLRHPNAVLRRSLEPEQQRAIHPFFRAGGGASPQFDALNRMRERWLVQHARALLSNPDWRRSHPAGNAVVFLGAAHFSLCEAFLAENFTPHIDSVWWRLEGQVHPAMAGVRDLMETLSPRCPSR